MRSADPADRRVSRVSTTKEGEALVAESRRRKTAWLTTQVGAAPGRRAGQPGRRPRRARPPVRAGPGVTRLRLASSETFRSLHVRNFRLFFIGQGISQIGNWLTLIAQTLLVLQLTDSGVALGVLAAAQFGPVLHLRRLRRPRRRPVRQAQAAHHGPDLRDGAVVRPGRPGLPGPSAGVGHLRHRLLRRRGHRLRQPGPTVVRRRDGARGADHQRGEPQQRPDDRLPHHRPRPGRAPRGHGGLRLGLPARRDQLHRRHRRPAHDRPVEGAPGAGHAPRTRAGAGGARATPGASPSCACR